MPEQPGNDKQANSFNRLAAVTIEIAMSRNENTIWGPNQQDLRGRWLRANLHHGETSELTAKFPDVPGMRITVDPKSRTARTWDPLATDEYADLRRELETQQKVKPCNGQFYEKLSDTELKTWLYWMARKVYITLPDPKDSTRSIKAPQAIVVSGHVPTVEELASFPGGDVRCSFFDNSQTKKKTKSIEHEAIAA